MTIRNLWDNVEVRIDTGCWEWVASIKNDGYGQVSSWDPVRRKNVSLRAHRVMWEQERGPIPAGLHMDHLCRNRRCVNPCHLRVVTNRENVLSGVGLSARNARKESCWRGHEFAPSNTYINPSGQRICRECKRAKDRRRPSRAKNDHDARVRARTGGK